MSIANIFFNQRISVNYNNIQELENVKNDLKVKKVALNVITGICFVTGFSLINICSIVQPALIPLGVILIAGSFLLADFAFKVQLEINRLELQIRNHQIFIDNNQIQIVEPIYLRGQLKETLPSNISELSQHHLDNLKSPIYHGFVEQDIQERLDEIYGRYIQVDQERQAALNSIKYFQNRLSKLQNDIQLQIHALEGQKQEGAYNEAILEQINQLNLAFDCLNESGVAIRQECLYQKKVREIEGPFLLRIQDINQEYLALKERI